MGGDHSLSEVRRCIGKTILFSLLTSDMPNAITSGTTYMFADDTTIYCIGKSIDEVTMKLNNALNELYFALCKIIHEGPGFRIPASTFRIRASGFWIPTLWIPDSKLLDSGFHTTVDSGFQTIVDSGFQLQKFAGFRIPDSCGA